jgi:polysaccharide biosynthesis protein PslH
MKLLWFSHFIPYPPKGGAAQRSFNLLRHASRTYEISLIAFNLHAHLRPSLDEWGRELEKYCANVEFWEMPIRWKSPGWWARAGISPLDETPYGCRSFWSPPLATKWKVTLQRHPGALVHFDSIDLALFAGAAAGLRKVLNHHNCESIMAKRRAAKQSNPLKSAYLRSQGHKLAQLESKWCPSFDVNIAVSQVDVRSLQSQSPAAHFHVVTNGTDTDYFRPVAMEEEVNSLIFAGSLRWYPNISALRYFVQHVWPLVKQRCPGVRFYVAGMKPSDSLVRWLECDPNIAVVPDPEDIRPWLARASVVVCPMIDGGGTRLKILDAMAMAKPVITTSVGCEGLRVKHGEDILVADAAEDFATMVSVALGSKALRQRVGIAGRALVEDGYSWRSIGTHLEEAYRCALSPQACVLAPQDLRPARN